MQNRELYPQKCAYKHVTHLYTYTITLIDCCCSSHKELCLFGMVPNFDVYQKCNDRTAAPFQLLQHPFECGIHFDPQRFWHIPIFPLKRMLKGLPCAYITWLQSGYSAINCYLYIYIYIYIYIYLSIYLIGYIACPINKIGLDKLTINLHNNFQNRAISIRKSPVARPGHCHWHRPDWNSLPQNMQMSRNAPRKVSVSFPTMRGSQE